MKNIIDLKPIWIDQDIEKEEYIDTELVDMMKEFE